MVTALVRSEFRKIFTVNLWWALLIPVALLSFGAGWFGTDPAFLRPAYRPRLRG